MMLGECGTSRNGKTYHYYKCAQAKKTHKCDKTAVKKEKIENAVIKAIVEKIADDKLMEQLSYQLHELQLQENQVVPALKQKLAEDFSVNVSDRQYLSVILGKIPANNELYKNEKGMSK